jgi:hypothetical protein
MPLPLQTANLDWNLDEEGPPTVYDDNEYAQRAGYYVLDVAILRCYPDGSVFCIIPNGHVCLLTRGSWLTSATDLSCNNAFAGLVCIQDRALVLQQLLHERIPRLPIYQVCRTTLTVWAPLTPDNPSQKWVQDILRRCPVLQPWHSNGNEVDSAKWKPPSALLSIVE